jgi:DNA-binding SARP family transcriptional activator
MSDGRAIECRTFGVLSVLVDGVAVPLGGPKQRLVLALLLCRANTVVGVSELIDALWADHPPRTAGKNLQVYVSKLRRIFGDRLDLRGHGYRLRSEPVEFDLLRFEQLAHRGRQLQLSGETDSAADLLGQCVGLWHEPLAEFADRPCLAADLDRWRELFLATLEDWAELEVRRGNHREVLAVLAAQVRPNSLRERLGAAWIRALAGSGRVKEALAHYEFVRHALADELGVDPSPALAAVHHELVGGRCGWQPPETTGGAIGHHWSPGNQLPRDLPDLVGRSAELGRVVADVTDHRGPDVVVVCGPVGQGKSAFAVHLAHLIADEFPDGQLVVDLADADGVPKPGAVVLAELLDMAGPGGVARSAAEALARWRSLVARRRLLLVLDNATSEDAVTPLLPGTRNSMVIVVSRARLSGLESVRRVRLPVLTDRESRELLGHFVGWSRMLADRRATTRILQFCGGSPLALRIVGAKLAALDHLSLADHVGQLYDAANPLDALATGGLLFRDRLDTLYRNLSAPQRAAYRRLAVLPPPPFEHGQVMAVLHGLAEPPQRALESLFECHLLGTPDHADSGCYDMPAFAYWHCRDSVASRRISVA